MFILPLIRPDRRILHVDADAFFASVAQALRPELKGVPLLVGDPKKRQGIVATASYEARVYGISSGMPMYQAMKRCPHAVVVAGRFEDYKAFSRGMRAIFSQYTNTVTMVSIDEAYLDLTAHGAAAPGVARAISEKIVAGLGITVSCGLASSKVVAKVASSEHKPHKLTVVPYGKEVDFLSPLPLKALPGIGPKTCAMLTARDFHTVGDIVRRTPIELYALFGGHGLLLWRRAHGIDSSPVLRAPELPKSISRERTFYEGLYHAEACLSVLHELLQHVILKLVRYQMSAATVFIKIRYTVSGDRTRYFHDTSCQTTFEIPMNAHEQIFPHVKRLFVEHVEPGRAVRLLGVGLSGLSQHYNLELFPSIPSAA